MAAQNANIFEELAPFSRLTVIPGVSVGQLNYVNQQDLFYTAAVTATGGAFNANTQLQFFQASIGDAATSAGYASGTLSLAQTSSRFPRGQAPANQAFVAVSAGFSVTALTNLNLDGSPSVPQAVLLSDPDDLYAIANQFSWDLTIGRGITRTIGPLAAYCGPDAVTALQNDTASPVTAGNNGTVQLGKPSQGFTKLQVPIVFPPLVNVTITAQNGSPFTLQSASTVNLQFRISLRGYLMTMPVG